MKRFIREGVEQELVDQLLSYKTRPEEVKSQNLRQFIKDNWDALNNSKNVYFEYKKCDGGDYLALYLIGTPDEVWQTASEDPKAYFDETRSPEDTDLLGATTAVILPGASSVKECWKRTLKKEKIVEGNSDPYGFDTRKNADPRKLLDDILKSRDVRSVFDRKGCRVRQVRGEGYAGVYRLEIECRFRDEPFSVVVGVQPTMLYVQFQVSADPRSNRWLNRRVKEDVELDPERLGYAARAFDPVLEALLSASKTI